MSPGKWFSKILTSAILILGIASLAYLGFITKTVVDEAGVIVNIGKDTTDSPISRIVNKATYRPPENGQLQLDQIDIMMHIVESTQSLPTSTSALAMQDIIVRQMNEYTISLSEYQWIRSQFRKAVIGEGAPPIPTRTTFGRYAAITDASLKKFRVFFRDSVDRGLL